MRTERLIRTNLFGFINWDPIKSELLNDFFILIIDIRPSSLIRDEDSIVIVYILIVQD